MNENNTNPSQAAGANENTGGQQQAASAQSQSTQQQTDQKTGNWQQVLNNEIAQRQSDSSGGQAQGQNVVEAGQGQGQGQNAEVGTQGTPASVVQLSQEDLMKLVSGVVSGVAPTQQQGTPNPQMTPEELDKMLNVYKVNEATLKEIFGETVTPKHVEFYNSMVQGAARQAVSLASLMLNFEMRKLQQDISPMRSFVEQQNTAATKERFFKKYPNLKEVEPLLMNVYNQLHTAGSFKSVKNEGEAFNLIVGEAKKMLERVPGVDVQKLLSEAAENTATGNQLAQGQAARQASPGSMPSLSRGGSSGVNTGAAKPQVKGPAWQKVI